MTLDELQDLACMAQAGEFTDLMKYNVNDTIDDLMDRDLVEETEWEESCGCEFATAWRVTERGRALLERMLALSEEAP